MKTKLFLCASSLCFLSSLPSQSRANNLLQWNKWQRVNPQYLTQVSITKTKIRFVPFYNGTPSGKKTTGLKQVFMVPKTGVYQFHFRGVGGVTGKFNVNVLVGNQKFYLYYDNWKAGLTVFLKKGPKTLQILTDTSNIKVDIHIWDQPLLLPAMQPTVDVLRADFPPAAAPSRKIKITSPQGQFLFMGLGYLKTPLKIPGFGYGLLLDPRKQIFLLGRARNKGGIKMDLSFALPFPVKFPRVFLQALGVQGKRLSFGSIDWMESSNW